MPARAGGAAQFTITAQDKTSRARAGELRLGHGVVQTPDFMPVGTNATVKSLDPEDLKALGAQIILANTYHLYLRPGHERVQLFGGLHEFMQWDRPILTDSGGFQVVSLGPLMRINEEGAKFSSHLDGSMHLFTPERSIEVQQALGPDIAVAFDQPVMPERSTDREVRRAMDRTHRWAVRSLRAHSRPGQALFGIAQGGINPELRAESATYIRSLPFDGINLGGLAGDETPEQRNTAIDATVSALEGDPRVRYLMGLGSPVDLLEAVLRGVTSSTPSCPPESPAMGRLGSQAVVSTYATHGTLMSRSPSMPFAIAAPVRALAVPTWRTSSEPKSCWPTAS